MTHDTHGDREGIGAAPHGHCKRCGKQISQPVGKNAEALSPAEYRAQKERRLGELDFPLNAFKGSFWATVLLMATIFMSLILVMINRLLGFFAFLILFISLGFIVQGFLKWRDDK